MKADSKSNGGACREGRVVGEVGGERGKSGEERTRSKKRVEGWREKGYMREVSGERRKV